MVVFNGALRAAPPVRSDWQSGKREKAMGLRPHIATRSAFP